MGYHDWTRAQKDLALELLERGEVSFGEFRNLSRHRGNSALPPSSVYIDLRVEGDHPTDEEWDLLRKIAIQLRGLIVHHALEVELVAAVPRAGTWIASALLERYAPPKCPGIVRIEKRPDSSFLVPADYRLSPNQHKKVVLFDNAAGTGGSILRAAKALEQVGYKVVEAIVVVDRSEGAADSLLGWGYKLYSVYELVELLDFFADVVPDRLNPLRAEEIKRELRA